MGLLSDDFKLNDECVAMHKTVNYTWVQTDCTRRMPLICQKDASENNVQF